MNIEELTEYCQSLKQVTTVIQWGDVLVFKVAGKMFCFVPMDESELMMNMNKKYWNTVIIDGSISDSMLRVWIEKSYRLVVAKLSKNEREKWGI